LSKKEEFRGRKGEKAFHHFKSDCAAKLSKRMMVGVGVEYASSKPSPMWKGRVHCNDLAMVGKKFLVCHFSHCTTTIQTTTSFLRERNSTGPDE
jgi:hypothetical protein